MAASEGFIELLVDTLSGLGPVSVRRMFGGAGVYADGVMFGLVADDTLYLRPTRRRNAPSRRKGSGPTATMGTARGSICRTGAIPSAFSMTPTRWWPGQARRSASPAAPLPPASAQRDWQSRGKGRAHDRVK